MVILLTILGLILAEPNKLEKFEYSKYGLCELYAVKMEAEAKYKFSTVHLYLVQQYWPDLLPYRKIQEYRQIELLIEQNVKDFVNSCEETVENGNAQ